MDLLCAWGQQWRSFIFVQKSRILFAFVISKSCQMYILYDKKEIYQPPYEIQELGWGEFEIMIEIHFNHPNMPPVQIPHMLRLHHSHQGGGQVSKKPLCS